MPIPAFPQPSDDVLRQARQRAVALRARRHRAAVRRSALLLAATPPLRVH
ncbi:hypothetical protein [Blastococcus sp. SYSU D00695]